MKTSKKSISFILSLAFIGVLIWLTYSYKTIETIIINEEIFSESEKVQEAIKEYKVVECDFNLKNPKYAFVDFEHYIYPEDNVDDKSYNIYFSNLSRPHLFSPSWTIQYTGGTTIKNTTFPQLVEMVKEDCGQFQKSKGNHYDEIMNWSYSSYTPEPELTEDEQKEKELEDLADELRGELSFYSEEDKKYVEETYGITVKSLDFEFLEWYEIGTADGFFVN